MGAVGEGEFGSDAGVPVFGEGFGELDADAVEFEVFAVVVVFEEDVGFVRDGLPHGDELKWEDVGAPCALGLFA